MGTYTNPLTGDQVPATTNSTHWTDHKCPDCRCLLIKEKLNNEWVLSCSYYDCDFSMPLSEVDREEL